MAPGLPPPRVIIIAVARCRCTTEPRLRRQLLPVLHRNNFRFNYSRTANLETVSSCFQKSYKDFTT